jgi:hypothetical protein
MKIKLIGFIFFVSVLFLVGCNLQSGPVAAPVDVVSAPTQVAAANEPPATLARAVVEQPSSETDDVLVWEGQGYDENGTLVCQRLTMTAEAQATIGRCDASVMARTLDYPSPIWPEMLARFAPFEVETADGRIVFQGQGEISSPAWEAAIASWAGNLDNELSSGRASAAGMTVLSGWLGEVPGRPDYCRHLVILKYGDGYASISPCAGGQDESTVTGWLETAEWSQFEHWFTTAAPLFNDNNYLDGQGQAEMSPADIAALSDWAEKVYTQLTGS